MTLAWSSLSRTSHFIAAGITMRRASPGRAASHASSVAVGDDISEKSANWLMIRSSSDGGSRKAVMLASASQFQLDPTAAAAVPHPTLAASPFNKDAANRLGGGGEEVAAAAPVVRQRPADEAEVGLVDEGGGLEGLTRLLGGQPDGGEFAQFVVDKREQFGGGLRVSTVDGAQELGDVGHGGKDTPVARGTLPKKNAPRSNTNLAKQPRSARVGLTHRPDDCIAVRS